MKSYKELARKYTPAEIAESFVFPGESDKKQREESLESFQKFRRETESRRSPKDKLISQLLQLRFLMEDYVKTDSYNTNYNFAYFLKEYIGRQQKKHKEFAHEIQVDPTELSQIINRRRPPSEKLIIRLEIHSNKSFPAIMWFKTIQMEKAFELVHDQELRETEHKHVKGKLAFSF
jgi:plasmid maintenance system antidote protein VapI